MGPSKSPEDFAISITTYTANIRSNILTSNAKAATGLDPEAYIASGKTMSAKVQDGKVIHVPYAD